MLQFTHLLMEAKSKYSPNIKPYLKTHDILDSVDGFSHISLNYNGIPPIKIKMKPSIFIMKRKWNVKYNQPKLETLRDIENYNLGTAEYADQRWPLSQDDNMDPLFDDIVDNLEEFGNPVESMEETLPETEQAMEEPVLPEATEKIENNVTSQVPSNVTEGNEESKESEKNRTRAKTEKIEGKITKEKIKEAVKLSIERADENKLKLQQELIRNEREKELKKKKAPVTITAQETIIISDETLQKVNVKESIRNIVNQFKEFEKDFEETEVLRRGSQELNEEEMRMVHKRVATEDEDSGDSYDSEKAEKLSNEAKESLREIINQFKVIYIYIFN